MFKDSPLFIRVMLNLLLAFLIIFSTLYFSQIFYESDKSDFIKLVKEPKVLETNNLTPSFHFTRGDGLIIEYVFEKKEIGCFADYQNILVGPVNIQLSSRRSQFIGKRGTVSINTIKAFAELPKTMPKGKYNIQMVVFPVCDGVPRDAFIITSANLDIIVD